MALDVKTQLVIVSAWGGLSGLLLAILSKSALRHLACIWAGMIASISLLEAWVKFRAPFVRRHVAFDVGRFVFEALNRAECGVCASMWAYRAFLPRHGSVSTADTILACVTAVLLYQALLGGPVLQQRAEQIIAEELKSAQTALTAPESKALQAIQSRRPMPGPTSCRVHHGAYVVGELLKIALLVAYASGKSD
ncbi:unnamed protein product (mitochondrion) [Plasmodiophora brassicae]|uniref:DUF4149 domain-containing protein n=1 Tax=Plasmodiophora brassicae TaxID=37360 RepID=A0A0G4IWC7_PLABS|nr:hypothetical protein PBRA_007331 [Plasmodiophora brassicae]SPQ95904.1 unnamed protein product [Plasmodiophora brassicae]